MTSLDAVAVSALKNYDFSPNTAVTLTNVSENVTYRVDDRGTGRSAALRIHRLNYHSKAAIESELCWMDALREDGVVAPPRPMTTRDGARIVTVDDDRGLARHVVLFEWLPGHTPTVEGDLVPSFRVLGTLAAKMHSHGSMWQPPASFDRYTCNYNTALGLKAMWGRWQEGLGIGRSERKLLSRLDTEVGKRLVGYGAGRDRFGLAHNDLRLANLLVDGDHIHVIDFDDCGYSWYMYDFAASVSFIEDDTRVPDWMSAWLDGYTSHRPLSKVDIEIIPTLIMFRRLLLVGWVGSRHEYADEAAKLGTGFTSVTCDLAEAYLTGVYLM
ncbi:aminoglycoside phosphotransferase [Pseudonocardia asaccharolytica DSM 44247 = NBRC 16224]|uniref:Aminoglycoside phosphotransferase n=2 Tax=Pseudonocardia asaccharolytica TaxID=54010 RepID=A0A511D5H8_9PSEU|nr:aminoglycoside phosphotransferase [Pseudonocardia asaccharolytica DSM 44247 = NBRC 16224]